MGAILKNTSFLVSWMFAGAVVFISALSMIFIRRFDTKTSKSSAE